MSGLNPERKEGREQAKVPQADEAEESADSSSDGGNEALSSPLKKRTGARPHTARPHLPPPPMPSTGHRTSCSGGRRPPRAPPLPPSVKYNLLHKLHFRQMYGKIQSRGSRGAEEMKVFSRLPGRLAFFIRDAVPMSALAAGHIFLGFSKCGQYLLSYTQTTTEGDQFDLVNFNYYYRLHWWLFLPYAKARKVAEVTLFANQGVYGNLQIQFCQWSGDQSRVVILGSHSQEGEEGESTGGAGFQHCFLTVTAVPSLGNCQDCIRVANSYDADDVAAAWNSCVRLSCLKHGVTVHTQFDLVSPYPKFEPKICLKRDNCVVVNTGNFLHSITVDIEQLGEEGKGDGEAQEEPSRVRMEWLHPLSPPAGPTNPISVNVGGAELSLNSMLGSPGPQFSPASFLHTSDSETESEGSQQSSQMRKRAVTDFAAGLQSLQQRSPGKRALMNPQASDFNPFEFTLPPVESRVDRKRSMADAAYDLTDDNFASDVPEKLSTFRKKRLADKKYEFTDDEEAKDKFVPLTRLRSKKLAEAEAAGTREAISSAMKGEGGDVMVCVSERGEGGEEGLAQQEDTAWADMLEGSDYPELFSPGGCIKKDCSALSPRISHQGPAMSPRGPASAHQEIFCRAKFVRRFVEVDDELISVITDVEDDDLGTTTGYHNALPLEVHGSGYTQMAMVSNSKAERLSLPCVRSLDLEQFCHETATRLCAWADKKFWFCNDYDVEVIDLDPASGDVTAVAVVLIQAAILTKSQGHKYNVSSLSRKQYQATFKFCWNIDSGQYFVVDSDSLKEISAYKETSGGVWNPARCAALPLLKMFQPSSSAIRVLTNESVIRGVSLKAIIDPDNLVALIMNDLE